MTYTDKAILELLNNPKIIPPNNIVHKYTVASHNDVELLVIKVILNIDINDINEHIFDLCLNILSYSH